MRPGNARELAALVALWLAAVGVVAPTADFPVFDDWVYAWSAFSLAAGNGLDVPEWSSVLPAFQAAWGALFVAVLGPHHAVLRLATLALALAGTVAWHQTLRGCGLGREAVLLATASTLFNPVYFLLAMTFMSDVTMVSLWQLGLYAVWRWDRAPGPRSAWSWMLAATLAALASAYVRQTGAALLVALAVAAWRRGRSPQILLPLAGVAAVMTGMVAFADAVGGGLPVTSRLADLLRVVAVSPVVYADGLLAAVAFIGVSLAPVSLAVARRSDAGAVLAWALLLALVWTGSATPLLRDGVVWGACSLGGAERLLSGRPAECGWSTIARLAALAAAALGLAVASRRGYAAARRGRESGASTPMVAEVAAVALAVLGAGMTALWLFADRYWLAPALLIAPAVMAGGVARPRAAAVAVALYGCVAVGGSAAAFSFYRDVDAAVATLVAGGADHGDIDAGYASNGHRRYLALERARSGSGRNATVPWLSAVTPSRYTVANAIEPGWKEIGRSGALAIVVRSADDGG